MQIALVHPASESEAARFFALWGMGELPRVSDPRCELYAALELPKGNLRTLFGPRVWWRGFRAGAPRWLGGAGLGVDSQGNVWVTNRFGNGVRGFERLAKVGLVTDDEAADLAENWPIPARVRTIATFMRSSPAT